MTKKQKRKFIRRLLIAIIIVLLIVIAGVTYLWMRDRRAIKHTEISLADMVSARMYVFLSQIEGQELSYEMIRESAQDIKLQAIETPKKERGVYERKLEEGCIERATQEAYEILQQLYKEILKKRLIEAGYTGSTEPEVLEQLMQETYQMSIEEYLISQVKILPDSKELIELYEGEVSYE